MCSRRDAGGEPTYTTWCSSVWPEKSRAGISSALICEVRFLPRGLLSSWAAPSISRQCRILMKPLPSPRRTRCAGRWSQRCWRRLRAAHRSAGESSKPAERSPACAQSAKLARARYGKPPDRPGGQRQSSNILHARLRHLNRYLKLQHLYRKQREKNSYEESLRRQLTPQHNGTRTSRLV